jgi:signal transduction histidine kinase
MSANAAFVAPASPPRTMPTRDPPSALALSLIVTLLLGVLLVRGGESLIRTVVFEWRSLIFWAVLVITLSFLPIRVDHEARLTLDDPLLLAMAFLYPPEAAALVAFLACFDLREIRGEVGLIRALFNRAQIGLIVFLAGATFRYFTDGKLDPWQIAVFGTGAAVAAEYLANVLLVSLHARAIWKLDLRTAFLRLRVGETGQFLATHLGYGFLALVLTHLFRDVGPWSVAAFLVPILVARQMLIRGVAISQLTEQLRRRERLLEKLSDRIVDERRDERLRLAGDLHDDILQALTRVWLSARVLERRQAPSGDVSDDLTDLIGASDASIEALRRLIHGLRQTATGSGGLIPTLEGLVRDLRLEWRAKIEVRLPKQLELEPTTQFTAYQFAREALINSLKHAHASSVTVSADVEEEELTVEVTDDGVGFDAQSVDSSMHFGLGLMQERVRRQGGTVTIQTAPGKGTTIQAKLPLRGT